MAGGSAWVLGYSAVRRRRQRRRRRVRTCRRREVLRALRSPEYKNRPGGPKMSHARLGRGAARAPESSAGFTSCSNRCFRAKPQPRDLLTLLFSPFLHKLGSAGRGTRVRAIRAPPWLPEGCPTPGRRVAQRLELHWRLSSTVPHAWGLLSPRTGGLPLHHSPPWRARGGTRSAPPVRCPPIPSGAGSRGRTLSQSERTTREVSPSRWPRLGGTRTGRDPGPPSFHEP